MVKMNNKGFNMVELVVVMGIFIGVMLIMSSAFQNLLGNAGQQMKSASTNTEGLVGLEMLRSDLENAGFGLPWSYTVTPIAAFPEVVITASNPNPVVGMTSSLYNEITPSAIKLGTTPSASIILKSSIANATNPLVAYLVIKSTNVALNTNLTSKKWGYVKYSSASGVNASHLVPWGTPATADDFVAGERVITILSTFSSTGVADKRLVTDASGTPFFYQMPNPPAAYFKPIDGSQLYLTYGVDPASDLRMPYNRTDYYVKKVVADMPTSCNPGTGSLYKGVVQQADGSFKEYQLLNCVGDMQVEFELDPNNDGNITYSPTLGALTPADIRSQLKNVRVYILAHEGKKDRNYSYGNATVQVGDAARPSSSGRTWDAAGMLATFGTDWKNYRWKVYTIVVHPKNLN